MPDVKTINEIVRDWRDGKVEYADELPTSIADKIVATITIEQAVANLRTAVVRAIGSIARAEGKVATRAATGTTYCDPMKIESLFEVVQALAPRLRHGRAEISRARKILREWLSAHPEADQSLQDAWKLVEQEARRANEGQAEQEAKAA